MSLWIWLRRSTPPRGTVIAAIVLAAMSTILALLLTTLSISLLGLSVGRTLASVFGLLIVVELIAFTRAPSRYLERRAAHRVGYGAVASWRRQGALAVATRRVDRMGSSAAAALARQVTADTNNLQALWLSIAIPLSGVWAGCGGAAVTLTLVLALSGTTTWLTALWWGAGNMALCALLLVVAYRGLGRLKGYALTLRRADFRYSEALGTARAAGPALRLLGHDEVVSAEAVATGREREIAAEALRRAEWVLTTALSALGLLGSVLAMALWHHAAAGHRSSLGLVALVGSFVVSLAPLELAGLLSRSVRSALSVTSITERLAEVMTEDSRPSRDEEVALPATSRLVCLTGPSGAGKSTYLAALCAITDRPFDDTVGGDLARQIARAAERGEVTWVPTESYWLDGFARDVAMVNPGDEDRARDIFEQLALPLDLRASWATLSRGEQSRAALARGLLHASSVLVLDEPTHALDDHSAALVATALRRFRGVVIVATHDPRLLEMADEVWTIATR